MSLKKQPLRKCLGCNSMKPKYELLRIVKNKNQEILIDVNGKLQGRGAYICKNDLCLESARKMRRLEKTFKNTINNKIYDKIKELIGEHDG